MDTTQLDQQDTEIRNTREAAILARLDPKQGDFIRFADGSIKRIAHVWKDENDNPLYIQPTLYRGDSSFYLGESYMSFSGSLDTGIDACHFARTNETMPGNVWFFRHDYARAHNGVYTTIQCPVWNCDI